MPIEEPEQLEALDDDEITALSAASSVMSSERTSVRISVPPPIPKQALERRSGMLERRSSLPPLPTRSSTPPVLNRASHAPITLPGSALPGSAPPGSLTPPPPLGALAGSAPPARALSSTPPSSGLYRISDTASEIERLKAQVREVELKVRLRDDLILELKRTLEEQRKLTAAAELALRTQQELALRTQQETATARAQDDLKLIRGIGPGFERKLHSLSVTSFAQIAAWTEADIERISGELSILPQRIARDGWIESAKAKLG